MFDELKTKIEALFFTRADKRAFLEDIGMLVEDGVPINQAVETVRDTQTGPLQQVSNTVLEKIAQGQNFADGLVNWFPHPVVEIIRAGEEGGTLPQTLLTAAKSLEQESYVMSSLLSSMLYPIAVIILGCAVAVYIRHSVFVNFEQIKPISEWPSDGQALVAIATFLQSWWWMVIICLIGLGFILALTLRNLTGEPRKVLDMTPVISIYRYTNAARFMQTMGMLINNGIAVKKALSIMMRDANPYIAWHLFVMDMRLGGGRENIADVFDTGLIQKADIVRLKVIARGKGFEHALIRLGSHAQEMNQRKIALTGKILGGILLAVGAGFAAFMVFAIYDVGSFLGSG